MIPYRSDSLSADLLFEDLLIERRNDLPAALSQARIRERRVGRIAASTAGVAGGALLMIMTFATFSPTPWRASGLLLGILFGTWPPRSSRRSRFTRSSARRRSRWAGNTRCSRASTTGSAGRSSSRGTRTSCLRISVIGLRRRSGISPGTRLKRGARVYRVARSSGRWSRPRSSGRTWASSRPCSRGSRGRSSCLGCSSSIDELLNEPAVDDGSGRPGSSLNAPIGVHRLNGRLGKNHKVKSLRSDCLTLY